MRLSRTIDLTGVTAAQAPQLQFQLSINTEPQYDNVIVEAHTVGQDNWTTLPDLNGTTQTDPPAECSDPGFLLQIHPFLRHYFGGADCTGPGSTGDWNSFTDTTGGWRQVAFDLSAYAGQQVEVSIAYVTDPASGGVGAFVDDTRLVIDGAVVQAEGFETGSGAWTVPGPPPGSPPNANDWEFGEQLVNFYAGTSTEDTLLLGFGLEQLATDADRVELVGQALGGLLGQ
jgi:bacillopeptidase F (M6 metalloprotease family)